MGMKCLTIAELHSEHEPVLVVSPVTYKTPHTSRSPRTYRMKKFCQIIALSGLPKTCLDGFLAEEIKQRTFVQNGHEHVEFNFRVVKFPERAQLNLQTPPSSLVHHWLGEGRAGLNLNLKLIGHGTILKFSLTLVLSTVCLGSTKKFLCLCWKLKHVNLLEMT